MLRNVKFNLAEFVTLLAIIVIIFSFFPILTKIWETFKEKPRLVGYPNIDIVDITRTGISMKCVVDVESKYPIDIFVPELYVVLHINEEKISQKLISHKFRLVADGISTINISGFFEWDMQFEILKTIRDNEKCVIDMYISFPVTFDGQEYDIDIPVKTSFDIGSRIRNKAKNLLPFL